MFLEIGFQRVIAIDRVLQQVAGAAFLAGARFHPLPSQCAQGFAAQCLWRAFLAGGAGRARSAVDHLLQLVFLPIIELEVIRVGHHAGEVHAGAELFGVAEADRQQLSSCTMAAAELLVPKSMPRRMGSSGVDQGPRTLL